MHSARVSDMQFMHQDLHVRCYEFSSLMTCVNHSSMAAVFDQHFLLYLCLLTEGVSGCKMSCQHTNLLLLSNN